MIKKSSGVTLMSLIIVIIILMILSGVGIEITYSTVNDSVNKNLNVELGIVKQAITEQYIKAVSVNELQKDKNAEQSKIWIGEQLSNISKDDLPDDKKDTTNQEFWGNLRTYKKSNEKYKYQEDLYYKLTPEELKKIGVSDSEDSYIVNYKTKEVYNCTRKINRSSQILYLPKED